MLEYDDTAFHFFALSSLACGMIPGWYNLIRDTTSALLGPRDDEMAHAASRTSIELEKAKALKKINKGRRKLKSKAFIISLILTIAATVLFAFIYLSISSGGQEVNSFDPFKILGIDSTADLRAIKKSYRALSLQFHPDKCREPWCEPHFVLVKKAYEVLTDDVARKCYEEHGNPDCNKTLNVGIGLPSFLLKTANRNVVLIAYLIIVVGIIPFSAWRYYSDSSRFGEKGIMYDTYAWFHHNLNEHTLVKSLPEIIAGSAEFRQHNMPHAAEEKAELSKLLSTVRSQMQKPKYYHPVCVTGNVLMHAHVLRQTKGLSHKAREDLVNMLRKSNSLIEAMITVCRHQNSLQAAVSCIKFGQFVAQAMWTRDSSLLQLPHFTENEAKRCEKGKASVRAEGVKEYIQVPNDEKKGLADFSDRQKSDVLECCRLIPDLSMETRVFVEDDDDDKVYEGDLCTARVTLTRLNLREGETAGPVHSPRFPFPQREAWWVVLASREGNIIAIEKATDPSRVVEHDIKFLAPKPGEYEFDLIAMSNAYVGLDRKTKVRLNTLDAAALPEHKIHPDDAELDDEPTLFEEMMNADVEEDSDSDEEDEESDSDEEEEEEGIRELSVTERKKWELRNEKKKAAAADDDESDDNSEAEEVYTEK